MCIFASCLEFLEADEIGNLLRSIDVTPREQALCRVSYQLWAIYASCIAMSCDVCKGNPRADTRIWCRWFRSLGLSNVWKWLFSLFLSVAAPEIFAKLQDIGLEEFCRLLAVINEREGFSKSEYDRARGPSWDRAVVLLLRLFGSQRPSIWLSLWQKHLTMAW